MARAVRWLRALLLAPIRDLDGPERVVLFAVAILRVIGIGWGLPASDGWDVDGIAPRDFLPGLVETFTPGSYFTYPPFHLALLALLTLPVTIVTLLRAPSFASSDVVPAFLGTGTMTAFALVARATSLMMSLGVVLVMGRISEAVFGTRRARVWAMGFAGTEAAATYYAHTTNLDLPMLFWGALAVLAFIRALERSSSSSGATTFSPIPNDLRRAAVFAAFAIASKDQGYALFAIAIPTAVAIWLYGAKGDRADGVPRWRRLGAAAGICVGLVLVLDGALFNPSGFAARLRFLTGPASQDFAQHARTWAGRASALTDTVFFLPKHYPVIAAPIFLLGIWMALRDKRGLSRLVSAMPLLVVISFTLAFNCVARRVEERFVMPQMQFLAVYAGVIGVIGARWVRYAAGVVLAWALRDAATIDANMLGDARYGAEEFMRSRFAAGERVETYGSNVYLPRFPAGVEVERVGVTKGKNPMPGITEVQDRLGDVRARGPRWLVVPQGFAWRYLQPDHGPDREGRILPAIQREHLADADTTDYVRSLFAEKTGYRLAARFHYAGNWLLPPRPLHASLATDVYIFERSP
jgi:hypothetical protein